MVVMITFARPLAAIMLATGMLLTVLGEAEGGTIYAGSASIIDVKTAVDRAVDGDRVIVPAGQASWTSTLTITKGITIQGQTTVAGAGTSGPNGGASPTVVDGTIILDDVPIVNDNAKLFDVNLTQNQTFRLTGITFRHGARTKAPSNNGVVTIRGAVHGATGTGSVRIDHCLFDLLYQNSIVLSGWITNSVVDHCVGNYWHNIFTAKVANGNGWNGGDAFGSSSYADAPYLGSEKFVFFEDCTINNTTNTQTCGNIDSYGGARYVVRHCYFNGTAPNTHGTETGGKLRGTRLHEWYQNTYHYSFGGGQPGLMRAGTGISWGNAVTGNGNNAGNALTAERLNFPFLNWGDAPPNVAANGANGWDMNVTESDGVTHVDGHAPHLFASGTHNGSNDSATLVDTKANWRPNQWAGYSLTNITRGPRGLSSTAGQNYGSWIISNTATEITFNRGSTAAGAPPMHFDTGDGYAIRKVLVAMDQPGRGQCMDVIAYTQQGNAYNATTGIKSHLRQKYEPLYSWLNTFNGAPMRGPTGYYKGPQPTVLPNREYYNEISPFDGTSGVGVGLRANRPNNCTPGRDAMGLTGPGAAYWATNEQKLYVCTAPNSWALYYTPYVYPHPLVSGAPAPPAPPAAPSNLRISGP